MADCVRCGYCCTVGTCIFGVWDEKEQECIYLQKENEFGQRTCKNYDYIRTHPEAGKSPAFGAGCSSSLGNTRRTTVQAILRGGKL